MTELKKVCGMCPTHDLCRDWDRCRHGYFGYPLRMPKPNDARESIRYVQAKQAGEPVVDIDLLEPTLREEAVAILELLACATANPTTATPAFMLEVEEPERPRSAVMRSLVEFAGRQSPHIRSYFWLHLGIAEAMWRNDDAIYATEKAQLVSRVAQLEAQLATTKRAADAFFDDVTELEARVAAMQADAERLDWIADQNPTMHEVVAYFTPDAERWGSREKGDELRAAVDAARSPKSLEHALAVQAEIRASAAARSSLTEKPPEGA